MGCQIVDISQRGKIFWSHWMGCQIVDISQGGFYKISGGIFPYLKNMIMCKCFGIHDHAIGGWVVKYVHTFRG